MVRFSQATAICSIAMGLHFSWGANNCCQGSQGNDFEHTQKFGRNVGVTTMAGTSSVTPSLAKQQETCKEGCPRGHGAVGKAR